MKVKKNNKGVNNKSNWGDTLHSLLVMKDTPKELYIKRDWICDEEHIWGDLSREEQIRLKNILKG